jgi:hypothetical protein
MRNGFRWGALCAAVALAGTAAWAQGAFEASVRIALPPVLPPMVVVEPGVQVVQDLDEEVFYVGGWYWVRRGPAWYRAQDHRRMWVYVEPRFVPPGLQRIPPGHYRRFHKAEWKAEKREEKERRRAWREAEKERRREAKHAEKQWKKEHHGGRPDDD